MIKILVDEGNEKYLEISPAYQGSPIYGIKVIPTEEGEDPEMWTIARNKLDNQWHFFLSTGIDVGTSLTDAQFEDFRKTTVLMESWPIRTQPHTPLH